MAQQTFSGVPGDFTAGQVLTAADMDLLREFILYLIKDGDEGDTGEVSPLILDLGSDIVDIVGALTITGDYDFTIGTANTQILAAASGSAAAGAVTYSFSGDTDTGFYRSGTNETRWATDGADRMTLNAGGQLGIGTVTPSTLGGVNCHIYNTSIASLLVDQGTLTAQIAVNAAGVYMGARSNHVLSFVTNNAVRMTIAAAGAVHVNGAFSKGSGSFDIAHPTKGGDWRLRHSFIEGPQADLIYRGTVTLSGGTATVDLDTASHMTDGTWEALCRDPWTMVASSGNAVEWSLSGKTLTITSDTADAVCSWLVIAERQDDHMRGDECPLCDDDGQFVTEYEREGDPFGPVEEAAT